MKVINLKKTIIVLMSTTLISSIILPSTVTLANELTTEQTNNPNLLTMPQENDYTNKIQSRNMGTKIVKGAIKFIIKNKQGAIKVVEKVAGKTTGKNFAKHYDKICSGLKPLLSWADIPYQAVYDSVYRVLVNAGVAKGTASSIALAIKEGISWFF